MTKVKNDQEYHAVNGRKHKKLSSIVLIGGVNSTREVVSAAKELQSAGWTVLLPQFPVPTSNPLGTTLTPKQILLGQEMRIENTDCVLAVNPDGNNHGDIDYNTVILMGIAYALKKPVFVLNTVETEPCGRSVELITTLNLNGDLNNLTKYLKEK